MRSERFEVRLDPATAERMNTVRGLAPASAWIARAIERELDREGVAVAVSAPAGDESPTPAKPEPTYPSEATVAA
jgi:hypothetical protein